jgi:hypothetical protein
MTTTVKEKKPFLPQRKVAASPVGNAVQTRAGGASRVVPAGAVNLVIGGEPRVHLLPAEVVERKNLRALKRKLLTYGAIVVVLVIVAYGVATFMLSTAQSQLDSARADTASLLVQQAKYGQVTKVNTDIDAIKSAQTSTTTQEIMWAPLVQSLEGTLPPDASLASVTASLDSPIGSSTTSAGTSATPSIPLQGPRIATVTVDVTMSQSEVPGWIDRLPTIKGYVDAEVASVTQSGSGDYAVDATIHLNAQAVSGRFATNGGSAK